MMAGRRERWAMLARALAVQGSWNYETLTGTGFGFAILPALRRLYRDRAALDAAIRRHEGPFNSHPYLMPLALGAVLRLEADGEDPMVIERFKAALRGSLGTVGDQLVWAGWRPTCVLAGLALLLAGAPWYVAVSVFLVLYNIGHVALMGWGLRVGLREGRHVAERLRGSLVRPAQPRLLAVGAFVAGLSATLVVAGGAPLPGDAPAGAWMVLAALAAAAGAWWGDRARRVAGVGVVVLAVVGLLAGAGSG
jgi:mannose PTS system EIID component